MTALEMATTLRQRAMRTFPLGHPHQPQARERLQALEAVCWDDPAVYPATSLEGAWQFLCLRTDQDPAEILQIIGA